MAKATQGVLSSSWDQFKMLLSNRWQTYGWYVLIRLLMAALVLGLGYALVSPFIGALMESPEQMLNGLVSEGFAFFAPYLPLLGGIGLVVLVSLFVDVLVNFGFLRGAANPKAEQGIKSIFRMGSQSYWFTLVSTIGTAILMAIVLGLGYVLLVLPGIFLTVSFLFSFFEVVLEGRGPIPAMKASYALVKGRWWSVFGTMLCWLIGTWFVMFVLQLIFGFALGSMIDFAGMEAMGDQMEMAANSGDIMQVMANVKEIMGVLVTPGVVLVYGLQVVVQTIASIVPVYGFLGIYLALKKK